MSRGSPFYKRTSNLSKPQLGTPVITITIESDATGLMQTKVTGNNPSVMQVVTLLVDCLKGYMDTVNKQSSMIIDPNRQNGPSPDNPPHDFLACTDNKVICQICGGHEGNHGWKAKENHYSSGRDSSRIRDD